MITHNSDSHQIKKKSKKNKKIHIRSQVKIRQSQSYNFEKLPKIQILQETLHTTHLLKLLDKMYKYEMDPTRTVGITELTRDVGQTDGQSEPPHNIFVLRIRNNQTTNTHELFINPL